MRNTSSSRLETAGKPEAKRSVGRERSPIIYFNNGQSCFAEKNTHQNHNCPTSHWPTSDNEQEENARPYITFRQDLIFRV
jgi:hypothetical protein